MVDICSEDLPINWKQRIGKGTYGSIYQSSRSSNYVAKVAFNAEVCRTYSREFLLHHDAFDALSRFGGNDMLYIPFPSGMGYSSNGHCCYYEMQRLQSPFSGSDKVVQVLLGVDILDHYTIDDTGQHMGPTTLANYLGSHASVAMQLENLASCIAQLYAIIQYGSGQTAYDIELVLCKVPAIDDRLRMAAIDFDKSEVIEQYDNETIKKMGRALMSAHFPTVRGNEFDHLYSIAKDAYLQTAAHYQQLDTAYQVIKFYERFM